MGEEGRFCGSVCGKEVFFFFFSFFSPFSYVKSARKLGSFCKGQQSFLGRGNWEGPQAWHPACD